MQTSEFIRETSRLEKYYEKEYTQNQKAIMFEQLKELKVEQYKNAIDVAFGKCKFLPKVAELKEYSKQNSKQRFKHLYKNLEWCEMYLDEY